MSAEQCATAVYGLRVAGDRASSIAILGNHQVAQQVESCRNDFNRVHLKLAGAGVSHRAFGAPARKVGAGVRGACQGQRITTGENGFAGVPAVDPGDAAGDRSGGFAIFLHGYGVKLCKRGCKGCIRFEIPGGRLCRSRYSRPPSPGRSNWDPEERSG